MASIQNEVKNMLSFIPMKIQMVRNGRSGNLIPQKKKQQNEKRLLNMKLTTAPLFHLAVLRSKCSW